VFLKEAKHFYREDAKTAKRQKGRSRRSATDEHGKTRKRLNKRGQVSFSALNIFCSWFRLAAEKET
jgi:hypothetical protein